MLTRQELMQVIDKVAEQTENLDDQAAQRAISLGSTFGRFSDTEITMAKNISTLFPNEATKEERKFIVDTVLGFRTNIRMVNQVRNIQEAFGKR